MRLLLQRVTQASVSVDEKVVGAIDEGYLVFLGVVKGDGEAQAVWLAEKIIKLKLFEENSMDIVQKGGSILVVSQFTLAAQIESGTKPDFSKAAAGPAARPLYELFVQTLRDRGIAVETGVFGAMMQVSLTNSGPFTLCFDR
ncbi:MAG TPA: D-aminoacyl-tRNA deacylase [Candidatus Peribacteraceae bacterium]|nr:D-aminoacyl-tRNA deacylase [Candidatus Peribacteraceae bacterium]